MLILSGISHFDGKYYPTGALDEKSALEYARRMGYEGVLLNVPGEAYVGSKQHIAALKAFRSDEEIKALYGFSGGGYNLRHVLDDLTAKERARIKLVVVLGAEPNNNSRNYRQSGWELVYRGNPTEGHMAGPRMLLASLGPEQKAVGKEPIKQSVPTQAAKVGFWQRIFSVFGHG